MKKENKSIYIYRSANKANESEKTAQEATLDELFGDEAVFLVYEDGSFIANEGETSILVQEYIK